MKAWYKYACLWSAVAGGSLMQYGCGLNDRDIAGIIQTTLTSAITSLLQRALTRTVA